MQPDKFGVLMSEYITVKNEYVDEITEKKSRFIATIRHVENEEEALSFIAEMKKKYWDARHNCSAYIVVEESTDASGEKKIFKEIEKCSDDGEPSKTAGSPMLDVIRGAGMKNTAVVVTRYFGGVLLGTGGLVRAYSQAATKAVEGAEKVCMRLLNKVMVSTDYTSYGKLSYIAAEDNIIIKDTVFTENVEVTCLCDDVAFGRLRTKMAEITAGKCKTELVENSYYQVEI